MLQFKKEYAETFKFHSDIKINGYFGYIIRLFSASLKYTLTEDKVDEMKLTINLFTVSFLNPMNFDDNKFFKLDKEIKFSRFPNLKKVKNFNSFMELEINNKFRLVNKNFLEFFDAINENSDDISDEDYQDLIFDSKQTIMKMFDVSFKRVKKINKF